VPVLGALELMTIGTATIILVIAAVAISHQVAVLRRHLVRVATGRDVPRSQVEDDGSIWTAILQLSQSHPFLPRRLAALEEFHASHFR
jgi:hypothetical protein